MFVLCSLQDAWDFHKSGTKWYYSLQKMQQQNSKTKREIIGLGRGRGRERGRGRKEGREGEREGERKRVT